METVDKEILVKLRQKLDDATNPLPYKALQILCSLFGLPAKQTQEKLKEALSTFLSDNTGESAGALEIELETESDQKALAFLREAFAQGVLDVGKVDKVEIPAEPIPQEPPAVETAPEETTAPIAAEPEVVEETEDEREEPVAPPAPPLTPSEPPKKTRAEYEHAGVDMGKVPERWRKVVRRMTPVQVSRLVKDVHAGNAVAQHLNGSRLVDRSREKLQESAGASIVFFWNDVVA